MICSAIGMSVACAVMGTTGLIYVTQAGYSWEVSNKGAGWVIALSTFLFVFNFAYGIGPMV